MSSNPFDMQLIIDRMKPLENNPFRVIGSIIEYNRITDLSGFTAPAIYIVPSSEVGKPNSGSGRQRADVLFGAIVVAQNHQYSSISPLLHEINPLLGLVRERLMGWLPPVSGGREVEWVRGDILDYNSSVLVWVEVFRTAHHIGGGNGKT